LKKYINQNHKAKIDNTRHKTAIKIRTLLSKVYKGILYPFLTCLFSKYSLENPSTMKERVKRKIKANVKGTTNLTSGSLVKIERNATTLIVKNSMGNELSWFVRMLYIKDSILFKLCRGLRFLDFLFCSIRNAAKLQRMPKIKIPGIINLGIGKPRMAIESRCIGHRIENHSIIPVIAILLVNFKKSI